MAEFAAVGGLWVLPSIDGMDDGQVRAHVSIAVGSPEDVTVSDVDLAIEAGGEGLAQTGRPTRLGYVSLRSTAAIAFFTFANPNNATPTRAVVTLKGESVAFDFGGGEDPGSLPVA
jgi:hypothetical protein